MNMELTENSIVLKPTFIHWLTSNLLVIITAMLLIVFSSFIKQTKILQYGGLILSFLLFIILFYRYLYTLFFTKWIITEEQIYIIEGIFSQRTDYLELYRIIDYAEKQTLIQRILNITTIYIYSGDKSNPILPMSGIKKNKTIISTIRNRVESQKKKRGIYEFTNQ